MPIAINGSSNTITGLAVGGLPDGCITADDLASGAGGKAIQLVNTAELSTFSTTSTSYEDFTGATLDITPSSNSNKIFFLFSVFWVNTLVGSTNVQVSFKTLRGSTNIYESNHSAESGSGGLQAKGTCNHIFIDSPSSTSAVTYKVQMKVNNSSSTGYAYDGRLMAFEVKV